MLFFLLTTLEESVFSSQLHELLTCNHQKRRKLGFLVPLNIMVVEGKRRPEKAKKQ